MHGLTLIQDEVGYDVATCDCGWIGPPCPGSETAGEFYADHIAGSHPMAEISSTPDHIPGPTVTHEPAPRAEDGHIVLSEALITLGLEDEVADDNAIGIIDHLAEKGFYVASSSVGLYVEPNRADPEECDACAAIEDICDWHQGLSAGYELACEDMRTLLGDSEALNFIASTRRKPKEPTP